MKKYLFLLLATAGWFISPAQQSFDSSFPFETEFVKKFSLYIPSSYDENIPCKLMLSFHPLNVTAISWRNELIDFAEGSGLLLVCPDGGKDGRVDDAIDYRFTTAVLDSVKKWYAIDESGIYAMGFSVGGKAMYEYGLENAPVFSGFIPVGAAIQGTSEVNDVLANALCKPFFLVHGQNDSVSTRYTPIKQALENQKAEVNFILMAGVGHSFSFPNRNSVLKNAFEWIDTVQCKTSTGIATVDAEPAFRLFPSVVSAEDDLFLGIRLRSPDVLTVQVWNMEGKLVFSKQDSFLETNFPIPVRNLSRGTYVVNVQSLNGSFSEKFIVK